MLGRDWLFGGVQRLNLTPKSEQSAPGRDPNISVSGLSDGRDLTNEAVLYSPGSVAVL